MVVTPLARASPEVCLKQRRVQLSREASLAYSESQLDSRSSTNLKLRMGEPWPKFPPRTGEGQRRSRIRTRPWTGMLLASSVTVLSLPESSIGFAASRNQDSRFQSIQNMGSVHSLFPRRMPPQLAPSPRVSALSMSSTAWRERQKQQKDDPTATQRSRAPNRRASLRWVVNSIENLSLDKTRQQPSPSPKLVSYLQRLVEARTQRDIAQVGRQLETLNIGDTEAKDVQERVIKATALAGLLYLSLTLLEDVLAGGTLPSPKAYTALLTSLRQVGRSSQLGKIMEKLGHVAKNDTTSEDGVDVVAFNVYLASLCDHVKKGGVSPTSPSAGSTPSLEAARECLRPGASMEMYGTEPDAASYATVIWAAAKVDDRLMVDELWNEFEQREIEPTLYCYNSLLCAIRNGGRSNDAEALVIFDKMMLEVGLQPDQYTLDLVLGPLIRAERRDQAHSLVQDFVESRSNDRRLLSHVFEAFFSTLVSEAEFSTAQALFDAYFLSSQIISHESHVRLYPTVRHFNLLLGGYRGLVDRSLERINTGSTPGGLPTESEYVQSELVDKVSTLREEATSLYLTMFDYGLSPDGYTLTTMMGLATSSDQVSGLLRDNVVGRGVKVTPEVLRAATQAYGDCGDPASACWFFDRFSSSTLNVRTWNGLIGALAKGASIDSSSRLSIESSNAAGALENAAGAPRTSMRLGSLVELMTCPEAARTLLAVMNDAHTHGPRIPSANSQSYCIVASALQYENTAQTGAALELFRNATGSKIPADGRFVNAILRCFGEDLDGALAAWKSEIRRACLSHEQRTRNVPVSTHRTAAKNLVAAYHGLLYVCGRALRPDVGLRVVYAMRKDGIEPTEVAMNCFHSGKRARAKTRGWDDSVEPDLAQSGIRMAGQFEALLLVECTNYDTNDRRRAGERRVRIIL